MKADGSIQALYPADIPGYIQRLQSDNRMLSEKIVDLEGRNVIYEKFYNVALTTSEVAKLHGYNEATVRKYVKLGLIPLHPQSSDKKILIRASVALVLDFDHLRRQSQIGF